MQTGTVLTWGCFDLLHPGHVRLLKFARSLGDRLIVGLNDDESVRRLKGPGRPILTFRERKYLLLGLACVSDVRLVQEDTADKLIRWDKPLWCVKGPDYAARPVAEQASIDDVGATLVIPRWERQITTSDLIARVLAAEAERAVRSVER